MWCRLLQFWEWAAAGKDAASIQKAAEECLKESDVYRESLRAIASIDLKKEEVGLLSLAEAWQLPFLTFTEEELKAVQGEFTPSQFVKKITGVENVCERSAVLGCGQGTLIRKNRPGRCDHRPCSRKSEDTF